MIPSSKGEHSLLISVCTALRSRGAVFVWSYTICILSEIQKEGSQKSALYKTKWKHQSLPSDNKIFTYFCTALINDYETAVHQVLRQTAFSLMFYDTAEAAAFPSFSILLHVYLVHLSIPGFEAHLVYGDRCAFCC